LRLDSIMAKANTSTKFGYAIQAGFCLAILVAASASATVSPFKVLFDATKAQMAGNADWVIDADVHNIGTGSSGLMVAGSGSESNPQRFPTPAASGITASTAESYWKGALSSWAIALVKQGFGVETLPIGARITYGDSTNIQDLSNYGIFVTDEPNIKFTAAEKTAIIRFVEAGGGFFMIADHTSSDRNNDGFDSLVVLNDLVTNNGISTNVFGIKFNAFDYSLTSSYVATSTTDPLIHGAAGVVAQMQYSAGTTMAITGANAHAAIWRTSSKLSTDVMVAYATYGAGKIVACGDSSPFDDGTGDTGDTLYNGWSAEVNGDHAQLAMNACLWLNPVVIACASDIDGNGSVDNSDIALLLLDYGACLGCPADLDGSGTVDSADIALLLLDYGVCP